jgi:hypothetical protein
MSSPEFISVGLDPRTLLDPSSSLGSSLGSSGMLAGFPFIPLYKATISSTPKLEYLSANSSKFPSNPSPLRILLKKDFLSAALQDSKSEILA